MTRQPRPSGGQRGSPALRLVVLLSVLLVPFAGFVTFIVTDSAVGRGYAIAALVGFLLVPLGVCIFLENVIEKLLKKQARAEIMAAVMYPVVSLSVLVLLPTVFAASTAKALTGMAQRYSWADNSIGGLAHDLGKALDPSLPDARAKAIAVPAASSSAAASPVSSIPMPTAIVVELPPQASTEPVVPRQGVRFSAFPLQFDEANPKGIPFSEELNCDSLQDIAAARDAHAPNGYRATALALAEKRYPPGKELIAAQDDKTLGAWFQSTETFDDVVAGFATAVHEGAHIWGFKQGALSQYVYKVTDKLVIKTRRLKNFDRSLILTKHVDRSKDAYASIYLDGKSGAQGFNLLLDEYNAYAHSLAVDYCIRDLLPKNTSISAKDGILTMMYYVEIYLQIARESHPKDYAAILADKGTRWAILTIWARAEHWLRKAQDLRQLGLAAEKLEDWVYDPALLAEIARVRDAQLSNP